ncbi:alpha/beta hydrolase [Methylibium sp. Pch-M]|uniref:YheT family hydrolase n=1 Tax=Methylibium sp. Pch-M TaxID=2082386 RepID=UPI001011BDC9|nr:alpha/beta fold hydrolase [Methylibium sp. Pch-M]QAZ39298.1 alpha/beta hydrolase [Methylibium sp. Pch-M]
MAAAAADRRAPPPFDWAAPWWLPGGNAQTIWPALFARRVRGPAPRLQRERWDTPDGDFIDVDRLTGEAGLPAAPLLVLFHGLEGSSASHYAQAFAGWAQANGWPFALPHFRGCSGELNRAPRAYHSGDFEEVGWVLARLRAQQARPVVAVGVSLGGNALLRWAEEAGDSAAATAAAVAAVSSPIDLAAGGHAIIRGFNRQVYNRMFLRTMKPKALAKLAQHPGLFDRERLLAARDLRAFDDVFTAPLHGFRNVDDYWGRGSAKPQLVRIRIPALVLNARNDPFVPAACLPRPNEVGRHVTLWQPAQGGHVGFPRGAFPAEVLGLPEAVMAWVRHGAGVA